MSRLKQIPAIAPDKVKYRADKANDYIVILADGTKVWVREGSSNVLFSFLSEDEKLSECRIIRNYYGKGFASHETGEYVFYTERAALLGKVGNPIFIGKIIKYRKHTNCYANSPDGKWKEYKIPQNRLFFVNSRYDSFGFYVIAKTSAKARSVIHDELDCEYMDSRATIVKIKDESKLSKYLDGTVIYSSDTRILEDLGVNYSCWDEEDSVY